MVIDVKTVYRHPKGRFEVRETTHHAFGNTYVVREAFLTPDEDRRRLPEMMRRNTETVRSHLRRLGALKTRKTGFWKVTEIREAQDMINSGYSRSEIARQLGRTESSVQSCMNSKKWREVEAR